MQTLHKTYIHTFLYFLFLTLQTYVCMRILTIKFARKLFSNSSQITCLMTSLHGCSIKTNDLCTNRVVREKSEFASTENSFLRKEAYSAFIYAHSRKIWLYMCEWDKQCARYKSSLNLEELCVCICMHGEQNTLTHKWVTLVSRWQVTCICKCKRDK